MLMRRNLGAKLASAVAIVVLVVGLMPLPAFAGLDDEGIDAPAPDGSTPLAASTASEGSDPQGEGSQGADPAVVDGGAELQSPTISAHDGGVMQLGGSGVNTGRNYQVLNEAELTTSGSINEKLEDKHPDSWKAEGADTNVTCNSGGMLKVSEDIALRAQGLVEGEAPASTVLVYGTVEWDDGNDKEHHRPETVTVHLLANGTESQSLTFGMGESGQWLFTFGPVPILDNEGKEIVYTVSVDEIVSYKTDVAKVGSYAFSITNTLDVDPGQKTTAIVDKAPEADALTYNGIWQALVKAGSTSDGKMMYALGADSVTAPSGESFGVRPSIGKNADEYYVWYYVKGDAFHTDSAPVCVSATIKPCPATITVKDQVYEYDGRQHGEGDTAYEDPAEIAEKVMAEGLLKSDSLTSLVLDGEQTAAGVYEGEIKVTGYAIGDATGNYAVTTVPGTLTITRESCEVAFVNFDGTVLQRGQVAYGKMPEYTGVTPERAATAQCTYTFSGWTPSVAAATDDATYTATYTETAKKGTLTFDLGGGTIDGKTSLTIEAEVGDVIIMPEAPVRDGYTFKYWKGSKYYPGDKYTVEEGHTFTAVWEKKSDSGTGGTDTKGASSGASGKSSPAKTGDELGATFAMLGTMAALASCLVIFATRCRRQE